MNKVGLLSFLIFLIPSLSSAQQSTSLLGKGILSFDPDSILRDQCVKISAPVVQTDDVRSTSFMMIHIKNKEELMDKLSLSGSASGSYGTMGGEIKAKFIREINWNQNSIYILTKATRITRKQTLTYEKSELKPEFLTLLRDSKFQFTLACGNGFTTGVNWGGEVFGLIEIKTQSYSEKQKIETEINASGKFGLGSFEAKSSFDREIQKLTSQYNAKIEFRHIGGKTISVPQTPEELIQLTTLIEFMSDDFPVALEFKTRDYNSVSNYIMDSMDPELKIRQMQIGVLSDKLKQSRNLYSKMIYILGNQDEFVNFNETALRNRLNEVEARIIDLNKLLYRSYSFTNTINLDPILANLDEQLPEPRRKTVRNGFRLTCETKPSSICGVKEYKKEKSNACNVIAPMLGSGPVCGTIYKLAASENCGVKKYKTGEGPVCGVLLYNKCYHGRQTYPGGPREHSRDPSCGVEKYRSCEDISFGVQEYNTCRHSLHGIEGYETCRHRDFGYEFESCRHFTHGPETFESCEVATIRNEEVVCPKF
jgi:hypothetical protein